MQIQPQHQLLLARERRDREAREAADARRFGSGSPQPLRQAIGLSLIRIGRRLAAEPPLKPAESR